MTGLSIIPYEPEKRLVWDEIIRRSKNGNFLHLRDYMDYHAHRFDEQSLVVMRKGKPVAVFPANRQQHMVISHAGLTYGGLIYGTELHAAEVLEIFDLLAEHYRRLGAQTLRYKAIPHVFHRYPAEEDLYALFRLRARLVRRDISSVIPLSQRIKLSDSRKCVIRKAEKHGVVFVPDANLSDYHRLLEMVLGRLGAKPVHTLAELELLQGRFPDRIRLFAAEGGGRMLAGALVYDFGHVVHTQYLASSDEGREIGALDFVLSRLMGEVYSDRQYLSFGISTERDGQYLNEGLIFQKEGFGARAIVHDFYELELT